MSIWECQSCGYRYDPARGDDATGVTPGTPFEKLPRTWFCPRCRAGKDEFEEADLEPDEEDEHDDPDEDDALDEEDEAGEDDDEFEEDDDDASEDEEPDEEFDEESDEDHEGDDEYDVDDDEDDLSEEEGEGESFEDDDEEAGQAEDLEDADDDDDIEEEGESFDDDELEDDSAFDDELGDDLDDEEGIDDLQDDDDEADEFEDEEAVDEDTRYICAACGWVYNPSVGHPESGVAPGTPFEDLMDDWTCPSCGSTQSRFVPHEDAIESSGTGLGAAALANRSEEVIELERLSLPDPARSTPAIPRRLRPDLSDLLFRPGSLFHPPSDEPISTLTLIGPRAEKPLHLTTPIVVAPTPFGTLTNALKVVIAKGTARVGTACTSGGPTLPEARRTAALYILEVAPGRPAPGPEELLASDAAEIMLGRGWTYLEEEMVPGATAGGILAPVSNAEELRELVDALRKSLRGPLGIRLPAGAIEADLESILVVQPDYVVLEGYGAGTGLVPRHVREHSNVPAWMAVHRARQYLDQHGFEHVNLLVAGDIRCPADIAKLLALGADAVVVSTAAVIAMGVWELRPGSDAGPQELLEMRFEPNVVSERLVQFLRVATAEILDFCRLTGKTDVHKLERSDLLTCSDEMARVLGMSRLG